MIDAMLGTGFEGEPRAPVSEAIEAINAAGCPVVACDVPSGMNASTGEAGLAVRAGRTVTFHGLKAGHVIAPGKHLCGEVTVAPIGIPPGAPEGRAAGLINARVLGLLPLRGAGLEQVHLRPGLDRRRIPRPDRGRLPRGRGGDPLRRRLRDRRRAR